MSLNFINQEFDRLKLLEEFITFKFEPRSRVTEGKRNIYYNDLKHDFEDEVNAYGFSPFIPRTYDQQKRDQNIMRYKNKEKFNQGIMKSIKKKAAKEEIKIGFNSSTHDPNGLNQNNNSNNINNSNSNLNTNIGNNSNFMTINPNSNIRSLNNYNNNINNFNRNTNVEKKKITEKESFLKKALENMAKNNLNLSDDSEIFNMEKNDKITLDIKSENVRTSILSRNYIYNKEHIKDNKLNTNKNIMPPDQGSSYEHQASYKWQTDTNNLNYLYQDNGDKLKKNKEISHIKNNLITRNKTAKPFYNPIKKLGFCNEIYSINYNTNISNLNRKGKNNHKKNTISKNDLHQHTVVDFYKKRMEYLSSIQLSVKTNPFDFIDNLENNLTKKRLAKYIPKSALGTKEKMENLNVHLIKKFSDFQYQNKKPLRSKTANIQMKRTQIKEVENQGSLSKSNSIDKIPQEGINFENKKEINRNNVNLSGAMKITSAKSKNTSINNITNHVFEKVRKNKMRTNKNLAEKINEEIEKNKI